MTSAAWTTLRRTGQQPLFLTRAEYSTYAGTALTRRVAFVAEPFELAELTLVVLAREEGAEFSFSSGSLADDTDVSFSSFSRLDVDVRSLEGSRIDVDVRRWCMGTLMVLGVRAEDPEGIRVGVAVAEADPARAGGGPIEPSRDRFFTAPVVDAEVLAVLLTRTLLPRVDFVAVDGASLMRRSLMTLPVSERAEGGRDPPTAGVPKIDDSRRLLGWTLAVDAGVLPAVPRTLRRLFSYSSRRSEWWIAAGKRLHAPFQAPVA